MILPLVQDMLTMSAQSLWTRFPRKYRYIKIIAKEKWPHIKIEEKKFKQNIKAQRNIIGNSSIFWIIFINSKLAEKEKYYTLIHEILHCFIDEVKMLSDKEETEKIVQIVENEVKNFEK